MGRTVQTKGLKLPSSLLRAVVCVVLAFQPQSRGFVLTNDASSPLSLSLSPLSCQMQPAGVIWNHFTYGAFKVCHRTKRSNQSCAFAAYRRRVRIEPHHLLYSSLLFRDPSLRDAAGSETRQQKIGFFLRTIDLLETGRLFPGLPLMGLHGLLRQKPASAKEQYQKMNRSRTQNTVEK